MENLTVRLREAYGRKEDLSKIVAEQNKVLEEVNGTVNSLEREAKEVVCNYIKDNFERVGTVKGVEMVKGSLGTSTYNLFYDKNRKVGVELGVKLYSMDWEHAVSLWQDVDEETFRDYTKNFKRETISENVLFYSVISVVGIPVALTAIAPVLHYWRKVDEIRSSKKPHILEWREALFYILENYDIGKQQQCKKLD